VKVVFLRRKSPCRQSTGLIKVASNTAPLETPQSSVVYTAKGARLSARSEKSPGDALVDGGAIAPAGLVVGSVDPP
jgi:hypothetical protein